MVENIRVGIIDYDESNLSADFESYLTDKLSFDIKENFSYDELSTMLINKDISAIILLRKVKRFLKLFSFKKQYSK